MPTVCVFLRNLHQNVLWRSYSCSFSMFIKGDYAAKVTIQTGELIAGRLPKRVLAMVQEWSEINKSDLLDNWHRCLRHEPLLMLDPLE